MRHRSSVAVVESDRGELHLVLSPARSIDTHVVRCVSTHCSIRPRALRKDVSRWCGVVWRGCGLAPCAYRTYTSTPPASARPHRTPLSSGLNPVCLIQGIESTIKRTCPHLQH